MTYLTPQEVFEYKQQWKPGHTVKLHSDQVDSAKAWCRRQLMRQHWSMSEWTDVYEHTFHFEDDRAAKTFAEEFRAWTPGFDNSNS